MKHTLIPLLTLFMVLILTVAKAQDVGININMSPASISVNGTGVIQVDICNNDFDLVAPANKLRPLISGNTLIEIVSIDNADFTIQSLGTGANNSIRMLYSKTLDPLTCARVNITVRGVTPGPNTTITGTLGFQGPQTPDNNTANDNSTTGVTVTAGAAATPVATGTNPTAPGTATGSVSLTGTGGNYPVNTPVSVTYTTPGGSTTVITTTTTPTGTIIIPNLPAGTYGPFVVSVSGGMPSNPSNSVTLVDPAIPDLTPILTVLPSTTYGTTSITMVTDVYELNNNVTRGPITVYITKDPLLTVTFNASATSINGKSVQNSAWSFDGNSNPSYYVITSTQTVSGGGKLTFGLNGTLTPGSTTGTATLSATILNGSGSEANSTNNTDSEMVKYFPR